MGFQPLPAPPPHKRRPYQLPAIVITSENDLEPDFEDGGAPLPRGLAFGYDADREFSNSDEEEAEMGDETVYDGDTEEANPGKKAEEIAKESDNESGDTKDTSKTSIATIDASGVGGQPTWDQKHFLTQDPASQIDSASNTKVSRAANNFAAVRYEGVHNK